MADGISFFRLFCGIALLFCPLPSGLFYAVYTLGGISDALDGFVARRFVGETERGKTLDTVADAVFFAAMLIKLLGAARLPLWLLVWLCVVAVIKCINVVSAYMICGHFVAAHTVLNKLTGVLLFVLPFTLPFAALRYTSIPVLCSATAAAVQEGHYIRTGRIG